MHLNPKKFLHGLLYAAPVVLLTLAACGGGGGGTTTAPVVAPSTAPSASTPVAGCHAINLNWTAVTGATGYNVYGAASSVQVISASNKLTVSPDTATSYTDTSATLSNTRYYQITAVNSAGEGPGSSVVSGTIIVTCANMGGSIQGNALTLSAAVSTLAGTGPTYAGSADGTGTAAQFNFPSGTTTDGTNLYIADTNNNLIRKIVISTGAVTTIATTGPTFNGPKGITISPDKSTLYVADTQNNRICKIVISTGAVTVIAGSVTAGFGDGTSTTATFFTPAGITTDGTNLYVADTGNNAIRKFVISTAAVTTVAGAGPATPGFVNGTGTGATFYAPQGITTDGTNLYVADTANNAIRQITLSGAVTTVAGSTTYGYVNATGSAAKFHLPNGITTDGTNLYIGDTANQTIRKIE